MASYIDADNLIKKMQERYDDLLNEDGYYENFTQGYGDALSTVENEPTADVREVKHGEWIYRGHHEVMGYSFECSICGRWMFANSPDHVVEEYPYCHCGAAMMGGKSE